MRAKPLVLFTILDGRAERLRKAYEMKSVSLDRWRDCVVDLRHVGDEF